MLLVSANQRRSPTSPSNVACTFSQRAGTLGIATTVQPEPLDHGEINYELGAASAQTRVVSAWIVRAAAPTAT